MSTCLRLPALLLATLTAISCGSSSTTSATAPATVTRCAVSIGGGNVTVPSEGGTGRLTVTTARECAWTAAPTAAWLSIRSGSSGQGDGAIEYVAAANADPSMRRAAVEVNDQRAEIAQGAGTCTYSLSDPASTFPTAGGPGSVAVRASSPQCTWTAVSEVGWVTVRSGASGAGNGTVLFDVDPGSGTPRAGTLLIAGLRHAVTQSASTCSFTVTPGDFSTGPAGGERTFAVATAQGCPWTAASNVPWATITQGSSGSGAGAVSIAVQPTSGPARTGTALVAGQTVTLSQAPGCSYDVSPLAHSIGASGGTLTSAVTTGDGCSWSATSNASWIVLSGATSGTGSGAVSLGVAPAAGGQRSGTVSVAGRQITVTQEGGCTFAITPASASVAAAGGTTTVAVSAPAGCAWSASSSVSWITVTAGSGGSGDGSVTLTVAASTGAARAANVTIAGQQFTVNQGGGCSVSLTPTTASVPAAGGSGSFEVSAGTGCSWSAATATDWITVTGGAGSGTGTVQYTVAASGGASRTGTIVVGGATFTITQGSGCAYSISPSSASVPAAGSTGAVTVTAADGCAWTAASNADWIHVTAGGSGSGNGTVGYRVDATTGGARSGTLTIAGQTFTINQANACSFSITPASADAPASGTTGSIAVAAGAGCAWSASSNTEWISVTSGAGGSGDGRVEYAVAANSGSSRTGTLTVAGRTFTINQAGGCSIGLNPASASVPAAGGTGSVAVTAGAGCGWSASSEADWITITSGGSGSGGGTVQYAVAANTGGSRTGRLAIGGQTFTVNQDANCSIALDPESASFTAIGGDGTVAVNTAGGCAWAATSNASWIVIASGESGSGGGTVRYAVLPNTGDARAGTLTIGGRTFTVSQAAVVVTACSYTISPPQRKAGSGGGESMFNVGTGDACSWSAVSNVPWITVLNGTGRVGSGRVDYAVAQNATGQERVGLITVEGQAHTVTQDR